MLNHIIRFALHNRLLVVGLAVVVLLYGGWTAWQLPIDVFPDLNRPRVVVLTEAPGLAPEEVETLISVPLETALNGATGVQQVRTQSGVGLSVVYVEFDWGTDVYRDRQIVNERLALVADQLPEGVKPQLAPISSIMGQIMIVGMFSEQNRTNPMALRTLADWVVRPKLLTVPGVAQVIVMGGQRMQYQVLVDPHKLRAYGVTLREVKTALQESNANASGGYLDDQGPYELLVRAIGRLKTRDDIERIVVKRVQDQSIMLHHVARIAEGAQVKRGDSSARVRTADGRLVGGPAIVLTINKQPGADTRQVTEAVTRALTELKGSALPEDVLLWPELYQQKGFIDRAIENIEQALGEGAVLVAVILFLFLFNVRTTFITLTAIPLSILATALVFKLFGLSINTMTLGGLAVAMGDLTDDAIVDVENIFRRLRENRAQGTPKPPLLVVFQASAEIRNSIVHATVIVIMVFLPLFALTGMEGRLFAPLGVAYIVSLLASLLVSMTVTPVLAFWLLPGARALAPGKGSFLLRGLQWLGGKAIAASLRAARPILALALAGTLLAGVAAWRMRRDFLPAFNEGAAQVNVLLPSGTSLQRNNEAARMAEQRLEQIPEIVTLVRRTGRGELDEHVEGVNMTEFIAMIDPHSTRSRQEIINAMEASLTDVPGIAVSVEQPLAHLISHMLSGVKAQIAIKVYGDDLATLRRAAQRIRAAIADLPGVRGAQVEPQEEIPQLRIESIGRQLEAFGLRRSDVNTYVETALQGQVVSQIRDGQRTFDLLVRLDEPYRQDIDVLRRLAINLPGGGTAKLEDVARIYRATGPSTIHREQVRRRILVQCNVSGGGMVDVVKQIKRRVAPIQAELPPGYEVKYGGQFESQQSAARLILILFVVVLMAIFLVLYKMFHSAMLALQVMAAVPMAFIGGVVALYLSDQTMTIAAMVGFVSLCGIATRNGIMLLEHYLHMVKFEGADWSREMIVKAGQDRLAPVLMTALTGTGLLPLVIGGTAPGKEILYPVATVILGGLVASTVLEFFVRPALFWTLGIPAARRVVENPHDVPLEEETVPAAPAEKRGQRREAVMG